jgi:hypothetical protein
MYWLFRKVTNYFKTTATDMVVANQWIPSYTQLGTDPEHVNSKFFVATQPAMSVTGGTSIPTGPITQADNLSVGTQKIFGAQTLGNS